MGRAYVNFEKENLFVDSYGHTPEYYGLDDFWVRATDNQYHTIGKQLQSNHTTVCGLYVVYFGHYLMKGDSLKKILRKFPNDRSKVLRDRDVYDWFKENYGNTIVLDRSFIDCDKFTKLNKNQSCKNYEKMIIDRKSL